MSRMVYGLTEQQWSLFQEMSVWWMENRHTISAQVSPPILQRRAFFGVVSESGGISAATYTSNVYTCPSGDVDLVKIMPSTGVLQYVTDSDGATETVTAFNWAEGALNDGQLVMVKKVNRLWVIENATCEGTPIGALNLS